MIRQALSANVQAQAAKALGISLQQPAMPNEKVRAI
jgi:hypothetical protein